jgi:hypothetical protein
MKSIIPFIIACLLLVTSAHAQTITIAPASVSVSGASTTVATVTVNATGLSPASGNIEIVPQIKWAVSLDGINWEVVSKNIPYTGGSLSATTVYMKYVGPSTSASGIMSFSGGGATASACMCVNVATCPCAPAAITEAVRKTESFYPNPAHSHLIFDGDVHSILIIDVTGREMYRYEDDKYITRHIKQLDISTYPTGVYLIRLNNGEMQKFVKE